VDALVAAAPAADLEMEVLAPEGGLGSPGSLLSRWYSRRWERRAAAAIAKLRPAVVHAHSISLRLSPAPLRAAVDAGVPVVMTVHDYGLVCPRRWMVDDHDRACERGFGAGCLVRSCRSNREGRAWMPYHGLRWLKTGLHRGMLLRWVDLFVCPSAHLASWMIRSMDLEERRVVALANFAPLVAEAPAPLPPTPRVLFSGRLSREKGADVLLRATPAVAARHPDLEVIVAGEGPERKALEGLARGLDLLDRVRFTGRLDPEDLGRQYRRASLCVLPTLWTENCPVSVLEAFAHGRPVVATRIGGVPELVEEGRTGSLFHRGDAGQLAEVLQRLLGSPSLVERLGAGALSAARERYSRATHLEQVSRLYRRLGGSTLPGTTRDAV
jgi:glycosyltransferase involved in cell wall biosynthesis